METKRHNGWANYETWAVNLWLTNDEGTANRWAEKAQECYDLARESEVSTRWERATRATCDLADELKTAYEEEKDNLDLPPSLWSDLLNAALSEVNWEEIAASLIEEVEAEESEAA